MGGRAPLIRGPMPRSRCYSRRVDKQSLRTVLRDQEIGLEVIDATIERLANAEHPLGQSNLQALRDWREQYIALLEESRRIVARMEGLL